MELLVSIVQIVKDLLGSLNPLRLFNRDYRLWFRDVWQEERLIFRIGYVLGAFGLVVLLALLMLAIWRGVRA